MLKGYTLPVGLCVTVHETEQDEVVNKPCISNTLDKAIFNHILGKKMNWCFHNNTCKIGGEKKTKTRKKL